MAERVTVEATGQAHVAGEPDLPSVEVRVVDPFGNVQYAYVERDPWIVENVIYGDVRIAVPHAFVDLEDVAC